MSFSVRAALCALLSLCPFTLACGSRARSELDEVHDLRDRIAPEPTPTLDQDETSLSREVRLGPVVRIALARNPDLVAARARIDAAVEKARAVGHLPDLEFKYELWGQPLGHPVSFGMAQTHMFGLRQTFPSIGSLDAKSRMAVEDARIEIESTLSREQDVVGEAERAFGDYVGAYTEQTVHLEHIEVASSLAELAKATYAAGKGSQQDVLRVSVQVSRLHADLADVDARVVTSKALLNTLMGRDLDAALGPPAKFDPATAKPRFDELEKSIVSKRPEVAAALGKVKKSEAALDDAEARANWPMLMLGADYWYMPASDVHHAYGAMVSISLPWLNPAHAEEVDAAKKSLVASEAQVASVTRVIAMQLREAKARFDAAVQKLAVIDRDLMPQAQKSLEAARASYAGGGVDAIGVLDAFRSYVDVRLQRVRAVARLQIALADVERAAGVDLDAGKDGAP